MNHGDFHVKEERLGLVFLVNVLAKTRLFCLDIEPFYIAATPQKGGEIKAGFVGRCPNRFFVLPPFRLARGLFVAVVEIFPIILIFLVYKLVSDDVVVTRIKA